MIEIIKNRLQERQFLRNVGVLMVGTVLAHLITVLAIPVTTRLYEPSDFSVLALYSSILGLLTTFSTFSLHIGIPLETSRRRGISLLLAAMSTVVLTLLVMGILILVFHEVILNLLGEPDFNPYLWLVIPGVLFSAAYAVLQMWFSRVKNFSLIARTRVTRSIGGTGTQLAMGFAGAGPIGLILGHMLYMSLGVLAFLRSLLVNNHRVIRAVNQKEVRSAVKRNSKYIYFTTPENFMNMAAVQLPVIAIAATPSAGEVGYLYLAMQLMTMPMILIGSSIGQAFIAEAPQRLKRNELPEFCFKIVRHLSVLCIPPLIIAAFLAPHFTEIVFGEGWQRTGSLVAWMAPWIALQFITSPISTVFYVLKRQMLAMWVQFIGFVVRFGSVILAINIRPDLAMEAFAVSSAFVYGLVLVILTVIIRKENESETS